MNTVRPDLLTSYGLDGISLVGTPAIEVDFVAFGKDEDHKGVFLSSDEKKQIVGPLLVPMQKIPRTTDEGVKYNLMFTDEDIVNVQHLTAKQSYKHNITLGHESYTDGVYVLETWIKESENDKSTDYGYGHMPVGTMFSKMQVSDDIIWQNVKDGTLNGFSIEMYTKLKDVEMSKEKEVEVETPEVSLASVLESIAALETKIETRLSEANSAIETKVTELSVELSKLSESTPEVTPEVTPEEAPEETPEESPREGVELSAEDESVEAINLEKELLDEQSGKTESEKDEKPEAVMLSASEARKAFIEKFGC